MAVQTCEIIVLTGVGCTVPKYPNMKNEITNKAKKTLLGVPLYRIERTGDLSSHGRTNGTAIACKLAGIKNIYGFGIGSQKYFVNRLFLSLIHI